MAPVFAALDQPSTWTDAEPLECCAVVPEAPDVATVSFVAPGGGWFRFLPGQFITLELPVPGGPIWRTYTISSSPSRPLTLGITVKAGPRELTFPAPFYLASYAVPNFYFHMTTAYNILRGNGVEIGKVDFLGG